MASVKNIAILTCMLGSLGVLAVVLLGLGGASQAEIEFANAMIATAPKPDSPEQHSLSAIERFMQGRNGMGRRGATQSGSMKEGLAAMKAMVARRETLTAPESIRDWFEDMRACDQTSVELLTQAAALITEEGAAFPSDSAELQKLRNLYRSNFSKRSLLLKDPRWQECLKSRGRQNSR